MTLEEVKKITPIKAEEIHARALSGDQDAVRAFVFYSAWKSLQKKAASYTEQQREEMYAAIIEAAGPLMVRNG